MRTIKNYVRAALPMLLGCLLFVACSDDDIAEKGVKEGLPASLTFKMVVPDLNDAVVTRAGVEQETALNQLMFLFYKKSDTSKPAFARVIDQLGQYSIGSDSEDESNRLYTVTISPGDTDSNGNELKSGEYYLYALANWQNGFCSYDAEGYASKSLDELKNAILARESGANVLDIVNNTPMTGIYGRNDGSITINEGKNSFGTTDETRVHLRRAVAKVIFNISTENGITFTPERYSIYNYSQSSTLMERSGWEGGQGTKPGNLSYEGNNSFSDFENLAFSDNTPNSFEFYMPENVQKTKEVFTEVKMREKRVSKTNETFKYAPENSTYIVIEGHYNGPRNASDKTATYDGDVKYTIQLGDFNADRGGIDNFTIRRNVKYTYNVKVAGVNNIITEAEAKNFDDETQPGAEGDLVRMDDGTIKLDLDAHFERVLLKIPVDEFKNPMFYVKTPYSRTTDGISADMTVGDDSKDYKWIHFTKPQSGDVLDDLTFGKFGGLDESVRTDVHGLLKEISNLNGSTSDRDNTGEHFIIKDGNLYTTAYIDEFFYTENPTGGNAQLSEFVNYSGGRAMNICTTKHISVDGKSSVVENTIISFSQASIWTVYPTDGSVSNPFGIEKNNEWSYVKRGDAAPTGLTNDEGWNNTQKLINNKNNNYDSSAGWVVSVNEGSKADVKFNFSGNYNYSYLAAMSRNRDTNDDGKISDDELRWYVPARNQCIALGLGDNNLGAYRPYNASNLSSATSADIEGPAGLLHTSSSGNSAVWWAIEGASFGNNNNNNNNLDMRCIRNLNNGMYNQKPTTFSTCNGKIITLSGLSSSCVRNSIMTGEYTADHKERQYSNTVPLAFEVASGDLKIKASNVNVSAKSSTVRRSGYIGNRTYTYTVNLGITNLPENASLTVSGSYTITSSNGSYVVSATTDNSSFSFTVYVNGSEICQVDCKPNGVNNNNRDYTFTPTISKASDKSEFTRGEIKALVNLAAANYTQDADGKDKGQWRVPNQRELVLMLGYWSELGMPTTGTHYASSTFFTATGAGKENPFMIDTYNGNPYMTLYGDYSGNFRIRPVRDVEPSASPQATHDSSYRPGGSIIK